MASEETMSWFSIIELNEIMSRVILNVIKSITEEIDLDELHHDYEHANTYVKKAIDKLDFMSYEDIENFKKMAILELIPKHGKEVGEIQQYWVSTPYDEDDRDGGYYIEDDHPALKEKMETYRKSEKLIDAEKEYEQIVIFYRMMVANIADIIITNNLVDLIDPISDVCWINPFDVNYVFETVMKEKNPQMIVAVCHEKYEPCSYVKKNISIFMDKFTELLVKYGDAELIEDLIEEEKYLYSMRMINSHCIEEQIQKQFYGYIKKTIVGEISLSSLEKFIRKYINIFTKYEIIRECVQYCLAFTRDHENFLVQTIKLLTRFFPINNDGTIGIDIRFEYSRIIRTDIINLLSHESIIRETTWERRFPAIIMAARICGDMRSEDEIRASWLWDETPA